MEKTNLKKVSKLTSLISLSAILLGCSYPLISNIKSTYSTTNNFASMCVNSKLVTNNTYMHETSDCSKITQTMIDDHLHAVVDKLAAKLNFMYIDPTEQVGKLLANVNAFVSSASDAQTQLSDKYNFIDSQAKLLGADVMDFNITYKSILPTTATNYKNSLIKSGIDEKTANAKATSLLNNELTLLNEAQDSLYSNLDYALESSTIVYSNSNDIESAKIHNVLNFAEASLSNSLTTIDDGQFVNLLKDYSPTGTYDVNTEIGSVDLSHLFSYTYDLTANVDLTDFTPEVYGQSFTATKPGDYDKSELCQITQPLSSLSSSANSYGTAEIFPGYKLHSKIIKKDVDTDSHKCVLTLQLGVSNGDDSNVVWSNVNNANSVKPAKNSGVTNITLSVNDITNQSYIAQHRYYVNQTPVVVNSSAIQNDDLQDVYYSSSTDKRTKLEVIMDKYQGDVTKDYDLKTNPIILDKDDYAGVDIATNYSLDTTMHANQKLELIATDVDTNYYTLSVQWGIIDEQAGRDGGSSVVTWIPWSINGKDVNKPIAIQYDISKELKEIIDKGNLICEEMTAIADAQNFINKIDANGGIDKLVRYQTGVLAFDTFNIALSVIIIAFIIVESVLLVAACGVDGFIIITIAMGLLCIAVAAATSYYAIENEVQLNKAINYASILDKDFSLFSKTYFIDLYRNDYYDDYSILIDSHGTFSMKKEAATDAAIKFESFLYTNIKFKNLLKDVINNTDSDTLDNNIKKEFINDLDTSPKTLLYVGLGGTKLCLGIYVASFKTTILAFVDSAATEPFNEQIQTAKNVKNTNNEVTNFEIEFAKDYGTPEQVSDLQTQLNASNKAFDEQYIKPIQNEIAENSSQITQKVTDVTCSENVPAVLGGVTVMQTANGLAEGLFQKFFY